VAMIGLISELSCGCRGSERGRTTVWGFQARLGIWSGRCMQ